jgi:hypothetical protein
MSSKPARYRDWPNVPEWIATAFRTVDIDVLKCELQDQARSSWMRAAYLADRAGDNAVSESILESSPTGTGPYRLTAREEPGKYYSHFEIVDSIDDWLTQE